MYLISQVGECLGRLSEGLGMDIAIVCLPLPVTATDIFLGTREEGEAE